MHYGDLICTMHYGDLIGARHLCKDPLRISVWKKGWARSLWQAPDKKKRESDDSPLSGDPTGTRTRVTAVKGRCLNRLTMGPKEKAATS